MRLGRPPARETSCRMAGALLLAGAVILAACGSNSVGRSPATSTPSTAASSSPAATPGGGHHLAYAALGASETYGIGANPVTNGYPYRLRDQLHLAPAAFADVAIPAATLADAYQTEVGNALAIQPTVCTVFFGVNDLRLGVPVGQFTSDLRDLVDTLRRSGAGVLIVGLPELGDLPAVRSLGVPGLDGVTRQWNAAMQGVATSTGAAFLNLQLFSGELASHPEEVSGDGLHPSNAGHERLATLILGALRSNGLVPPS